MSMYTLMTGTSLNADTHVRLMLNEVQTARFLKSDDRCMRKSDLTVRRWIYVHFKEFHPFLIHFNKSSSGQLS
jgi:hypothetical protein